MEKQNKETHLSNEEQLKLFLEIKNGNLEARQKLILYHRRLVYHIIANHFSNVFGKSDYDDFVSLGTIGLIKAVDTFDVTKQITFATYASRCILN